MIEPTVIRFEATDVDPTVSDEFALLAMDTVSDGRVAVQMRRSVFVALFERMQQALKQSTEPSPDQ